MAEIAHEVQAELANPAVDETAERETTQVPDRNAPSRILVFADARLFWLVVAVPVLTTGALVAFQFFPGDPMLASGLGAVVVGFVVFLLFASRIPEAFATVRLRGLVPDASLPAYEAFEAGVGRRLNSPWAVGLAAAGALIGLARYPVGVGSIEALLGEGPRGLRAWGPVALGDMAGEALIGAAAGLAIWRMVVAGVSVYQLGRFPLRVQVGHPDRCGGFAPLGNVCLWNAFILAVPGAFLGWWIVAGGPGSQYDGAYVTLHTWLAVLVVVLACIAFLAPLWGVHRTMARSAATLRDDLENHGRRIDRLARQLIEAGDGLSAEQWDEKSKELERRQVLYRTNAHIPTWPIDVRLAAKFGTSQLVPLLGVTGLSKPLVEALKAVGSFIDTSG
jgi:hypothetical protein